MQRTGQTLPCQAPSRPSYIPGHPSLNRRCNTSTMKLVRYRPTCRTILDSKEFQSKKSTLLYPVSQYGRISRIYCG